MGVYVIPATRAPTALVLRHGPHNCWNLYRWDLSSYAIEPGASFRGKLYPRRCDVSPDGKYFVYFALRATREDFLGHQGLNAYTAVSKVPWMFALAAWRESGTWTRGVYFTACTGKLDPPDHGSTGVLENQYGLAPYPVIQYAVERNRGWLEHADSPARNPRDAWDEERRALLYKPRPGAPSQRLLLEDQGWDTKGPGRFEGRRPALMYESNSERIHLAEATWADWDASGRLLVGTQDDGLRVSEVKDGKLHTIHEHGLQAVQMHGPAPQWARTW